MQVREIGSSFSNNGLSLSGSAAWPGFRLLSNFRMPFRDMSISNRTGVVVRYAGGMVGGLSTQSQHYPGPYLTEPCKTEGRL